MNIRHFIFVTALAVMAAPAFAQNTYQTPPLSMPSGHTMLTISATERMETQQDTLIASLRYEKESPDPKALQNEINGAIKKAIDQAKSVPSVKASTEQYYVYPYRHPESAANISTWRGAQGIELRGKAAEDILKLTGELQAMGFVMNSLSYVLSPEKSDEIKDSLMESALKQVQAKAQRAAKALGKSSTELVEISVDTNVPDFPRPMMAMMKDAEAAQDMQTPSAEPGMSEITLTVSARALLKP